MALISDSPVWKKLTEHYRKISNVHMSGLFSEDSRRFEGFSCESENIFVDFSKNRITQETLDLLFELARTAEIETWRERLFNGEVVNHSTQCPALHPVFRGSSDHLACAAEIRESQDKMLDLAEAVRNGKRTGHSGRAFTDIVHIGIGGSYIGASLVFSALSHLKRGDIRMHFISGCDFCQTQAVLNDLKAESTLFVIVSKSFTTTEILLNAQYVKNWLGDYYKDKAAWRDHFVAVSADKSKVLEFGISQDNFCATSKDIGGRYSIWSAAALSVVICIGKENFKQFLAGARSMDKHFIEKPFDKNLPILLGLIGVWYASFFRAMVRVVLPYDYALRRLPAYIQQLEMESNGKSVTRDGLACNYPTAPVVWGSLGIDGQHSFYQMLHQGTQLVPADFILTERSLLSEPGYDATVRSNFLAQMQALMLGGNDGEPYQVNRGNQPSNAILLKNISPQTMGELMALYEHRTFSQAFVWQINPFDQWGVELGKQIASKVMPYMDGHGDSDSLDTSTRGLLKRITRR